MNVQDQLVATLKLVYRKHVQMDDSIGWDELADHICNTLCNAIGDDAFISFANRDDASDASNQTEQS